MRTLIINFKNYPEVFGEGSVRLAHAAARGVTGLDVELAVAPPVSMIATVAARVKVQVFSQSLSGGADAKSTGANLAGAVKGAGAQGTLLNHSEARLTADELTRALESARSAGLKACVCAATPAEVGEYSRLGAEYLAVEPPELIGSGRAVSRAAPGAVTASVKAAGRAGYRGRLLCGAGIASGEDVAKAVKLGAAGVLVSSSVVKSDAWESKVRELARSLC